MLNLYANADRRGFLSLVASKPNNDLNEVMADNRKIISTFAVLSILIISVIANGSQYQTNFELQKQSTIASYTSMV